MKKRRRTSRTRAKSLKETPKSLKETPAAPPLVPAGTGLSAQHARFVEQYLIDLHPRRAAIAAGYAPKNADVEGSRLLTYPAIHAAIAAGKAAQLADASLSAARVLEELRRVAFANSRDFFGSDGRAKHPHQLTAEQGAALQSFDIVIANAAAGDDHTDTVHKFKFCDKLKALELLAKHFALLVERVDVTLATADARVAILNAARARVTKA